MVMIKEIIKTVILDKTTNYQIVLENDVRLFFSDDYFPESSIQACGIKGWILNENGLTLDPNGKTYMAIIEGDEVIGYEEELK